MQNTLLCTWKALLCSRQSDCSWPLRIWSCEWKGPFLQKQSFLRQQTLALEPWGVVHREKIHCKLLDLEIPVLHRGRFAMIYQGYTELERDLEYKMKLNNKNGRSFSLRLRPVGLISSVMRYITRLLSSTSWPIGTYLHARQISCWMHDFLKEKLFKALSIISMYCIHSFLLTSVVLLDRLAFT